MVTRFKVQALYPRAIGQQQLRFHHFYGTRVSHRGPFLGPEGPIYRHLRCHSFDLRYQNLRKYWSAPGTQGFKLMLVLKQISVLRGHGSSMLKRGARRVRICQDCRTVPKQALSHHVARGWSPVHHLFLALCVRKLCTLMGTPYH